MDRIYFLIGADSPVMRTALRHMGKHREFQRAIDAFKAKHGGDGLYTYGNFSFAGLRFDRGIPPDGWKRNKDGMCVPDGRCKLGKQIRAEVEALPRGFDHRSFSDDLGDGYTHFAGGQVYFSTLEQHGDNFVLSVPFPCRVKPEGCTELKMSEYWQIREAAGRTKEEGAA